MLNSYNLKILEEKNKIIYAIRNFFLKLGYLEVDTPLLVKKRVPENTIKLFETFKNDGYGKSEKYYLVPSPEITMKKFIAETKKSIFQISKCFRNCEVDSPIHNHEFTMLEYYTVDSDYLDSIKITENLFLAFPILPDIAKPPFKIWTMQQLFQKFLNCDLEKILQGDNIGKNLLKVINLDIANFKDYSTADIFNYIFLTHIEKNLKQKNPVVVLDYPAIIETTGKIKKNSIWTERWELYVDGIEILNCYTEETDLKKLKNYFKSQNCEDADDDFILQCSKLEKCSGVALGLDRIIMILLNLKTIEDIAIK